MAFYVSAIDGDHRGLIAGPFRRHGSALAACEAIRRRPDLGRAAFWSWGTARHRTGHQPVRASAAVGYPPNAEGWCDDAD